MNHPQRAFWISLVLILSVSSVLAADRLAGKAPSRVHDAAAPGYVLDILPDTVVLTPGGAPQVVTIVAFGENGFTGSIHVSVTGLPVGVTAGPASFNVKAGSLTAISMSASVSAKTGTTTVSLVGSSGTINDGATFAVKVQAATTTAALSATSFNFGNNLVGHASAHTVVAVTNTGTHPLILNPALTGDASYSIVAANSCKTQLAAGQTCDVNVQYLPAKASNPNAQSAVLSMHFGNVPAGSFGKVAITGVAGAMKAGVVTATNNPQVARYTMTLPFPGKMKVRLGKTTTYSQQTWFQSTDIGGGQVTVLVAGMLQNTMYHMAATVELSNGIVVNDADHTFTTGSIPAGLVFNLSTETAKGLTPQRGLEFLNPVTGVAISDLAGNELWTYATPPNPNMIAIDGAKMLANGDVLLTIGPLTPAPLKTPFPPDAVIEMREVDLAGDTVKSISIEDLNAELSTATCAECNVVLQTFHHDVEPLPNGHWLVLAATIMNLSPTSTPPLTNLPAQAVIGDVIVDLDENLQPVWAWNEFNHLDPNRHPINFPDWTHTNAVLFSPDDGNIVVSMRHQNWVVKVNYANGTGNGDVLWRLGEGGDFKLESGVDPTDWPYAQHGPGYFSTNTSGVFSLGLMDNGDDRIFPSGSACNVKGALPASCLYTTIPVFKIDEVGKTAKLTFHQILPGKMYSSYGGNTEELANGNVEYDLCGVGPDSFVEEVTREASPRTVWEMKLTNGNFYRAFRIPGFYPGVPW